MTSIYRPKPQMGRPQQPQSGPLAAPLSPQPPQPMQGPLSPPLPSQQPQGIAAALPGFNPAMGMPEAVPAPQPFKPGPTPMPVFQPPQQADDSPWNQPRGKYTPGAEPMPARGGFGGQRQMMQQMMKQMQMLQEMMRQQQMMRNMYKRNRGGMDNPYAEQMLSGPQGPNFDNFAFKKGGSVKEKKMAMGGMGGMSGPGMYGVAPGMSRGLAQKVGAANQAEAMSQLKGAIGAPGGVAGGTMKNALGALRGMKKGGKVEEAGMVGKEVSFMKKKGAPKSMIKHEEAEMKGYAKGGGIESKGKTKGKMVKMAAGGMVGRASARADGCAQRGKTKGKQIKMAGGGSC